MEATEEMDLVCAALIFVSLPFAILWKGFVLMKLWNWFIVFPNLAPLSFTSALGMAVIVSLFYRHKSDGEKSGIKIMVNIVSNGFVAPLFHLGIGCIIHQFT